MEVSYRCYVTTITSTPTFYRGVLVMYHTPSPYAPLQRQASPFQGDVLTWRFACMRDQGAIPLITLRTALSMP